MHVMKTKSWWNSRTRSASICGGSKTTLWQQLIRQSVFRAGHCDRSAQKLTWATGEPENRVKEMKKVQNWKDHLWRVWWATHGGEKSNWSQLERSARKIGPVPRQNYFPSRWRIEKVALLLRHCTCIQIFSIQAYLTDHLALLLFNSINLPHGPLEAIMISPPPSTRLPHHPQKEDRRKNFLLTTRLLCTHVGRSRARWLVSNWRLARSTPTQRASPAFHWENSCSPSFLPSLWIISHIGL